MVERYYIDRKAEYLQAFDDEASFWRQILADQEGEELAESMVSEARQEFESLLNQIPYIGGDENPLTASLVESVHYLAFYKAMQKHNKSAAETGKVLYDAVLAQVEKPQPAYPTGVVLTPEQLMQRRRQAAEWSQERRYPADFVFEFVEGDGVEFDYGYDFSECAALKLYHAHGADEFTPFYCYLDFPKSRQGLRRTMALSEGYPKCNHRFKAGRPSEHGWPPPFLRRDGSQT